jgi:hypothetical protein
VSISNPQVSYQQTYVTRSDCQKCAAGTHLSAALCLQVCVFDFALRLKPAQEASTMTRPGARRKTGKGRMTTVDDDRRMGNVNMSSRQVTVTSRGPVNKSEAIRHAINNNPGAGPTEIANMLRGQGIEVSARFVASVRWRFRGGGKATEMTGGGTPLGTKAMTRL